ncbi:MAG: serine O-acetyltransferase [Solirubrobacteraceae bacterium]
MDSHQRLQELKRRLRRLWILSPERLWLASIALDRRGHWILAFWLKQLNGLLYHNSLSPGASVSPDVHLGHNSLGVVVNANVEIGRGVVIWHNVTLTAGRLQRRGRAQGDRDGAAPAAGEAARARIVVEDNVKIGANAVVIAPRGATLRLGRGARVGAGTVVTEDVPAGATIVGAAPRLMAAEEAGQPPRGGA